MVNRFGRLDNYIEAIESRVLWILGSHGEMNISRLRSMTGLKKAGLDAILVELEKENRIVIRHRSIMLKR